MSSRALLIVDVQNDFCEGGALAVAGGNAVAKAIRDYVTVRVMAGADYSKVITSQDWHAPLPDTNCGHFAVDTEPDFTSSWPVHCVAATDGAELHDDVYALVTGGAVTDRVYKGYRTQSYSAFEGVTMGGIGTPGRTLLAILRSAGVTDLDVCGLATDYCVAASARDALALGFNVRILSDLCAGVDPETSERALSRLAASGAEVL